MTILKNKKHENRNKPQQNPTIMTIQDESNPEKHPNWQQFPTTPRE